MCTEINPTEWLSRARKNQKIIERFAFFHLFPKIVRKDVRRTAHFQEWITQLMNYPRIMELSLTLELLELNGGEKILDISSPKLMALFLALETSSYMHISDIEPYFVDDFEIYRKRFKKHFEIEVFDAHHIPHPDNSFDRVYSISVLEHLPGLGDLQIMKEINRILKPEGVAVITLPAWSNYIEEWQKIKRFYWPTEKNSIGESFYQRRYDSNSIHSRLVIDGFKINKILFVAEVPLNEPYMDDNGVIIHNAQIVSNLAEEKMSKVPFMQYKIYKYNSKKYHYITTRGDDPNVRQVVLQFIKQ